MTVLVSVKLTRFEFRILTNLYKDRHREECLSRHTMKDDCSRDHVYFECVFYINFMVMSQGPMGWRRATMNRGYRCDERLKTIVKEVL